MEEPKNSELPTHIGEFEIRSLLGSGGSGEVYEATWGPRRVALKVLRSDLLPTEAERSRFYSEAQILADLGHPGIVKILSYGALDDGRPYLAMELLEGQPLADFVAAKTISPADALGFFAQVADAVTAIHDKGLIHRDLKPENVLVAQGRYAVLLDFGIAKSIDAPASTTTQEGGVRGTPAYMAPERFFGQPASVASDIYELGVLLYSMLAGALPWDSGLDPEARLNPLRPSQRGAALAPELETVIMRALSTRPEARQTSVAELVSAVMKASGAADDGALDSSVNEGVNERTTAALSSGPQALASAPQAVASGPQALASGPQARGGSTPRRQVPLSAPPLVTGAVLGTATTSLASAHSLGQPLAQTQTATTPQRRARWALPLGIASGVALVAAALILSLVPSGDEQTLAGVKARRDGALNIASSAASESEVRPTPTREGDDVGLAAAAEHHPSDTVVLIGMRGREIRQSKAFGPIFNQQKARDPLRSIVRAIEPCGIDIVDDIDWLTLGIAAGQRNEVDVIIAGAFTRDAVEACVSKVGQSFGAGAEARRDGDVSTLEDGEGVSALVWLSESSFMFTTRADGDEEWLRARKRGDDPATRKGPLAAALARSNTMASLWIVGRAEDLNVGKEYEGIPFPELIEGAISVTDRLVVGATLDYGDEALATKAHEALGERFKIVTGDPLMSGLFEEIDAKREGTVVNVSIQIGAMGTSLVASGIIEALRRTAK